jgi:putative inorganic carbon (hco3(-)) transporter
MGVPIRGLLTTPLGQFLCGLAVTAVVAGVWLLNPSPLNLLLLGLKVLIVVLAIQDLFIPTLIFVVFSQFRLHEAFPFLFSERLPQFLAVVALGALVWHLLFVRSIKPFWSRELGLLMIFFVIATFGVLFALDRGTAIAYWEGTFVKVVLMSIAIAWTTRRPSEFALAARAFTVGGILLAAVALYNKANGIGLVEGTRVTIGRELGSLIGDPNDLALTLLFPLGFAGALFVTRVQWFDRILGAMGCIMIVLGIVATQSRGGLLGLVAVAAVLAMSRIRSKLLIATGAIVLAVGLYSVMAISQRQSGGAAEQGIDESAEGRLIAWETAWNMAKARPITGVGIVNSAESFYFYTPIWSGKNHAVHSTWLQILAETGFPGFILFLLMVIAVFRSSFASSRFFRAPDTDPRMRAISVAMTASFVGFCVSGTFLTQGLTWPFYIILSLTVALAYERETEQLATFEPALAPPSPVPATPRIFLVSGANNPRGSR